jgi:hypothetical protein
MAKVELELDDKGEFVGQLPAEVDAILKRIEIQAHGTGYRSGQGKAAEDAKKQIEDAIKAERAKLEAQMPLERERFLATEEENKTLKQQLTDTMRESSKSLTKREEAHAEEITKRAEMLKKRDARIQQLTVAQVKTEAIRAGARTNKIFTANLDGRGPLADHRHAGAVRSAVPGLAGRLRRFVRASHQARVRRGLPASALHRQLDGAINSDTANTAFRVNGLGLALTVGTILENESAHPN